VHLDFSGSHKVIGIFLTFVACLSSAVEIPSPSAVDRQSKPPLYTGPHLLTGTGHQSAIRGTEGPQSAEIVEINTGDQPETYLEICVSSVVK